MKSQLDHLHTPATVLAGDASKAAVGSAAPSPSGRRAETLRFRRRRKATTLRLVALLATVAALVGAGSAALNANSVASTSATPNTARAIGGAPDLGPAGGLDLNAGVIDIAANPSADGYWLVSGDGGVFSFGAAPFHGSTGATPLNAPIVGLAPTPAGDGYWLAALDGGVFSFGAAEFHGSLGGMRLQAPILSIEATPTGEGYWLIAADGGVFSFGDAVFHGSAATLDLAKPVIDAAVTPTGNGYWLLTTDGGVYAFGDAPFLGASIDPSVNAVAIAAEPGGYRVARADGTVASFGVPDLGGIPDRGPGAQPVVGMATHTGGGFWLAQGEAPPPPPPQPDLSQHPFLVCTRRHESDTAGGYRAVSASGTYRGAYQFSRSTWNNTARHAGRFDLVGVDPAAASPADQDFLALHLYRWQGAAPWGGRCAGK